MNPNKCNLSHSLAFDKEPTTTMTMTTLTRQTANDDEGRRMKDDAHNDETAFLAQDAATHCRH